MARIRKRQCGGEHEDYGCRRHRAERDGIGAPCPSHPLTARRGSFLSYPSVIRWNTPKTSARFSGTSNMFSRTICLFWYGGRFTSQSEAVLLHENACFSPESSRRSDVFRTSAFSQQRTWRRAMTNWHGCTDLRFAGPFSRPLAEHIGGHGLGDEVALHEIDAEFGDQVPIVLVLDPFGDDAQVKFLGQIDGRF